MDSGCLTSSQLPVILYLDMKATIELPDALYREVKAKSAREGRTVREVTEELYRSWLARDPSPGSSVPAARWADHRPPLREFASGSSDHSIKAIRESISKGWDEAP